MSTMTSSEIMEQPAEVASKVLRRAQVSKMTRVLQNRLALANVKVQHGWENLSLDTIEPKIELELKRKRPTSSSGTHISRSDTSSSISTDRYVNRGLESSPLTAPLFSDDLPRSGSIYGTVRRVRYQPPPPQRREAVSSNHARVKTRTSTGGRVTSWKRDHKLPQSSPVYPRQVNMLSASKRQCSRNMSYMSDTTSLRGEDNTLSEEDDEDLPVASFHQPQFHRPSPRNLRTPSPTPMRARVRSRPFNHNKANPTNNQNGSARSEEGVDLLMYLATSPSPATARQKHHQLAPPSTPPPRSTPLPSSMMTTPGNSGSGGFLGAFGAVTPGMNFNFSDYLNVTPSPAQAAWRTPGGMGRTPMAAREARRRLNFDSLLPPSPFDSKGLGMELGGELENEQ